MKGYIALMSILIIAGIATGVTATVVLTGLGSSQSSSSLEQSYQAKALADSCAEEALELIRQTPSFAGTASPARGAGTCTYTVIPFGVENRTVTASGTVGTSVRKISIILDQITPQIFITTWQEVADF